MYKIYKNIIYKNIIYKIEFSFVSFKYFILYEKWTSSIYPPKFSNILLAAAF